MLASLITLGDNLRSRRQITCYENKAVSNDCRASSVSLTCELPGRSSNWGPIGLVVSESVLQLIRKLEQINSRRFPARCHVASMLCKDMLCFKQCIWNISYD